MASPTTDRRFGLVGNIAVKAPVATATTGNITLYGEQSVGGVTTNASRVLVHNQTNPAENGIYDSSTTAWSRSSDADGTYDLGQGTFVYVNGGSYAGNTFVLTSPNPITVGTSNLTWTPLGVPDTSNVQKNLIDHFGAIPYDVDPTADNTTAIQNALDAAVPVLGNARKFRVTGQLVWRNGSKLIGQGNWSGVSTTGQDTGTFCIFYDGVDGLDAVCRLSQAAVGTFTSTQLLNCGLSGCLIDCNGKANIGAYYQLAFYNGQHDFVTVTNSKQYAFLAMRCFAGSVRCWVAFRNRNNGIVLGKNVYSWSNSNVDEVTLDSFFASYSGYDANSVALNTFNDVSNIEDSIGIGLYDSRSVTLLNPQAVNCGGPGLYIKNAFYPTNVISGYIEGCCLSSHSVQAWSIWVQGVASEWTLKIDGMHLGLTPAVRMTGSAPSRVEAGVVLERMPFLNYIYADWNNYRLVDCDRYTTIETSSGGVMPTWFDKARNATGFSLSCSGVLAAASTGAGALPVVGNREGVISGLTRSTASTSGVYHVALSEVYPGGHYTINLSAGSTSVIRWSNKLNNGFDVSCYTSGVLSDDGAVFDVQVFGKYST